MAFQVSPGVNTSEIDLTNVVVGAGTSTGGGPNRRCYTDNRRR